MNIEYLSLPPEQQKALRAVSIMGHVFKTVAEQRSPEDLNHAIAALNSLITKYNVLIENDDNNCIDVDPGSVSHAEEIAKRAEIERRLKKRIRNRNTLLKVIDEHMSWHAMEILDTPK